MEELGAYLWGLPPAAVYLLAVVMDLGRGDSGASDLLGRYAEASNTFGRPEWAVNQIASKLPLADYLRAGRQKLRRAGLSPDRLWQGA